MRVVVASRNPVKTGAVRQAFAAQFPEAQLEIIPTDVDSGVGDQPMSDTATRAGARARAEGARAAVPDADFWVGLEGGIEVLDDQLLAFAWMAIAGPRDPISQARSPTLPLPSAIRELVEAGMELGEANDRVFATVDSKQGTGAFGLLSDGRYTRQGIYAQTLIIALIPFVHPLYPHSAP